MKTNRDENRGVVPNQTVELFFSLSTPVFRLIWQIKHSIIVSKGGKTTSVIHSVFMQLCCLCIDSDHLLKQSTFSAVSQTVCLFWTNRATLPFLTAEPTRILSPLMLEIIKSIIRRLWCDLVRSVYGRSALDMSWLFWQIISKWQTDWGLSTVTGFKLLDVFHENFHRSRKDSLLKQLSSIQRMIRWCWWWWWWAALGFQVLFLSKI